MADDYAGMMEEIAVEVAEITEAILAAFSSASVSQDEKRDRFETLKGTPEGIAQLVAEWGEEDYHRQVALAQERQRVKEVT